MLQHVFVLTGPSAAGKSYSADLLRNRFGMDWLNNDHVAQCVQDVFDVAPFSIGDRRMWQQLETVGNVGSASYWVHLAFLQQFQTRFGVCEGARYSDSGELEALRRALADSSPGCGCTPLALYPDLDLLNSRRAERDIAPIDEDWYRRYGEALSDFQLVADEESLLQRVADVIGEAPAGIEPGVRRSRPCEPRTGARRTNLRRRGHRMVDRLAKWLGRAG